MIPFVLLFAILVTIAGVSWAAYLDEQSSKWRWLRMAIMILIGLASGGSLVFAGILKWAIEQPEIQQKILSQTSIDMNLIVLVLGLVALNGVITLVPFCRRLLSATFFQGLDANNLVHIWSLYIFLNALTVLALILFNVDPMALSQKLSPSGIYASVVLNMLIFVLFVLVASGLGIRYGLGEVLERLGLKTISPKHLVHCGGIALILTAIVTLSNSLILQFVDPEIIKSVEAISDTLAPEGNTLRIILSAIVVGVCAGVGEELFFRGLIQPVFGIVPSSLLFVLTHSQYGVSPLQLELLFVSLVFALVRWHYNTTAAIFTHIAYDFLVLCSVMVIS